jgi:cytochrome P450
VTDAAVLKAVLSGSGVSKDPHRHWNDFPLLNWVNTRSMFTAYGSEQRRLRNFVAPAFTNRRTAAPEPRIRSIADELVVALDAAPKGDPVDLRERFATSQRLRGGSRAAR